MIRYSVSPQQFRADIEKVAPNWYALAEAARAALPAKPTPRQYDGSLWTRIKCVYRELQGSKCIYCETRIEGPISNDIEHFRPKSRVTAWKVPEWLAREGVATAAYTGPRGDPGYRNLAYCPWNYATSCKPCNSVLKKNYFPICGKRDSAGTDPAMMNAERALFVYPIGTIDDDPCDLIEFVGMHPKARPQAGTFEYHRALVVIEVFHLNDAEQRKELFRARAESIRELYLELERERTASSRCDRDDASEWIAIALEKKMPHSSCRNSFKQIYDQDAMRARRLVDDAKAFLRTGSLATGP